MNGVEVQKLSGLGMRLELEILNFSVTSLISINSNKFNYTLSEIHYKIY
jgi:hypothetical protein